LRNLRAIVFLIVGVCLAIEPLALHAQITSVKITSKPGEKQSNGAPLNLSCQVTGTEGLEFLLATASGGAGHYQFENATNQKNATSTANPLPPEDRIRMTRSAEYLTVPVGTVPSGAATVTEIYNVGVKDKKGKGVLQQAQCTVTIHQQSAPGTVALGCPGPAHVGEAFQIVNASGGTPPYTYSAPDLQKPLVLDPTNGWITGASSPGIIPSLKITVQDASGSAVPPTWCRITVLPQSGSESCDLLPASRGECVGSGNAKNANINNFWGTNGGFVFFNQVNSIYNGASNSETVSADIGTLNFPFGMQLNIGSNVQAGAAPPTAVSTGTIPTLAPSAAAQAAQNMLYGGTIFASGAYPLLAVGGNRINGAGNWGGMLDFSAREGIDIQNFKSGTSTGLTSPSSHSSAQLEGYFQVNSTNLVVGSSTFAGALFIGGSYGYTYTSHAYIRDYGIAGPENSLGQISGGVILNGIAKIAFSRAFGPSQTYIDGTVTPTPITPTTINNFKTLSFELSYQSPAPGSK
jgi:hypothetical protein